VVRQVRPEIYQFVEMIGRAILDAEPEVNRS
jgi:hypothetical protein